MDEKVVNAIPLSKNIKKEDLGNYKLVSLTLTPGKVIDQIFLEAITNHVRDMKVVGTDKNKIPPLSPQHCP